MSSYSQKRLKKLKGEREKSRKEALPLVFLIFGLIIGAVISELMNVVREMIQLQGPVSYKVYTYIVLIAGTIVLGWFWRTINRMYIKPIDDIDEEIKQLENKKDEE